MKIGLSEKVVCEKMNPVTVVVDLFLSPNPDETWVRIFNSNPTIRHNHIQLEEFQDETDGLILETGEYFVQIDVSPDLSDLMSKIKDIDAILHQVNIERSEVEAEETRKRLLVVEMEENIRAVLRRSGLIPESRPPQGFVLDDDII